MTHDEMIAVIKAHKEGKRIQYNDDGQWRDCPGNDPGWYFGSISYRVKPEPPKPLDVWVNQYFHNGSKWVAGVFETEDEAKFAAGRGYLRSVLVREVLP